MMEVTFQRKFRERAGSFLRRQLYDIRVGGLLVLLRKCALFLEIFLEILVAVPLVVVARLLCPLMVIRFGELPSAKLGPLTLYTERYLCERDARVYDRRVLDIFYHQRLVCNQQLKKMWERTLHVNRLAGWADLVNRLLPGGDKHVIPWRHDGDRDIDGLFGQMPPHLSFTTKEEHRGQALLRELGIPEGASFVCFHARDPAYLNTVHPNERDWRYHDFRNSTIANYVPAAEELVQRGYFAVRLGAVVQEALQTKNRKIIDYPTNGRTDFLDIFLGAKCRFFFGDTSGILCVPMTFRRPVSIVNVIPLEHAYFWGVHDLLIPKKLWLRAESRFMTFREILGSGVRKFVRTEQYEQGGIEVIENSAEEIAAVVVEMDERLKGTWKMAEEDVELQRRFWSLFKPSDLHEGLGASIGTEFLRQNRELLD